MGLDSGIGLPIKKPATGTGFLSFVTLQSELNEDFEACARAVGAALEIGNKGIELQLHTLSDGLLELNRECRGVGTRAVLVEESPSNTCDDFEPRIAASP